MWNYEMTNSSLLITFSLFNFFPLFVSSRWGRRQVYLSYLNIFTLRLKICCKFCLLFQLLPRTLKTSCNIAVFSVVQQGFSYWLIFCKPPKAYCQICQNLYRSRFLKEFYRERNVLSLLNSLWHRSVRHCHLHTENANSILATNSAFMYIKRAPNKIILYILHVNVMAAEPGCQEQFYNLIIIMMIIIMQGE